MRPLLVLLHRWFGLGIALFLLIAGLTGAIISWDHELDAWLNPALYHSHTPGEAQPLLQLAAQLETSEPRLRIRFMPLQIQPGESFTVSVEPRIDQQTGQPYALGYNQVAMDPVNGTIQARREWGKVSLDRQNLLPFLYKLHYSLHIPDGFGLTIGVFVMGLVAIIWCFDCLIALWIAFPRLAQWRKSFAFRWRERGYRRTFDLHRSGGVWIWFLLLTVAVTSVGMNLKEQVMRPVVSWFSALSPSPFARRSATLPQQQVTPTLGAATAILIAAEYARQRSVRVPAGGLFVSTQSGVYGVGFFNAGNGHGDIGLGNPWIYVDSRNGQIVGADIPGTGSAGDIFLQAIFPLHSGRIIGLPGRILMSALGLLIALLSVTGIMIWHRKRQPAKLHSSQQSNGRYYARNHL